MVLYEVPFLLAHLRGNDESAKLVTKANCGLKHDMFVVSKDIFVEQQYSVEKTPLEEPCVEECV